MHDPKTLQRQTAPDVTVTPRATEPQDKMYRGELAEAEKLIEARLRQGVHTHRTGEIRFKNPDLVGRWFNQASHDQRIFQGRQAGWVPVRPEMIADLEQLGVYGTNESGHVVRGERGHEHLLCMTKDNAQKIALAKTAENDRRMGSRAKTQAEVAEAAAAQFGAEAGDFVAGATFGEIKDGYERISRVDE